MQELCGSDRDSDGSAGGEPGLLLLFLDFVECCFKNRARAGRGRGAGRLCCFTFISDCSSGSKWWSESTEEFWGTAGVATLLTLEQSLLTASLQFIEFKQSFSTLTFVFVTTVSPVFAGDKSLRALTDTLSLLEKSCLLLFEAVVIVLDRSVL